MYTLTIGANPPRFACGFYGVEDLRTEVKARLEEWLGSESLLSLPTLLPAYVSSSTIGEHVLFTLEVDDIRHLRRHADAIISMAERALQAFEDAEKATLI